MTEYHLLLLIVLFSGLAVVAIRLEICRFRRSHRRSQPHRSAFGYRPKPPWVAKEVLRLKALMPENGCRKIAATFNALHAEPRGEIVSKSTVAKILKDRNYELTEIRRKIKNRRPKPLPRNKIWAVDLTFLEDHDRPILGLIDHGARACLSLESIRTKASIEILKVLIQTIEKFGNPDRLRTDNEPVFTSRLFRFGLFVLGIRHQRTAPFAPWQNGRIERFFGTFKEKIRQWSTTPERLPEELRVFRFWYNHVRPHQHLAGFTPAQVWTEKTRNKRRTRARFFSEWEGLLGGFWFDDS